LSVSNVYARALALTTRSLGHRTGVSQVALDLALALSTSTHASELQLQAWVPRALPAKLDGISLGRSRSIALSPLMVASAVLAGEAPPRSVLAHLGLLFTGHSPQKKALPVALEVVNGVGAHALHQLFRAQAAKTSDSQPTAALVVHESPRHFSSGGRVDLPQALAALRSYDYRIFVSERGRAEWEQLTGLDPARSFYIPNCVREEWVAEMLAQPRAALRKQLGYAPDEVRAVCVGALSARKGQDLVVQALRALADLRPALHIDFIGEHSGPFAERVKAEVRGAGLQTRVRFLGARDDVYARVYAADAFVLASRAEAFPLAVLEAMALGTCVIAAAVDGVCEQIASGQSGLLFAAEDVGALTSALRLLAQDAALRAGLAAEAQARYRAIFSRAEQLRRWQSALEQMLAERF
jgi:glycosyltransferase involved in cell wall biosynthesis